MITNNTNRKKAKAIGLMSGGLDSVLAAKVVKDLGIEVEGLYFSMPWASSTEPMAVKSAKNIGIKITTFQLDEDYLKMLKKPKYGFGSALNPCVDCKIYFLGKAAERMKETVADFIFTGEVLGQRPMSQMRNNLRRIEKDSGLEGRLLRPLCARLLEPTIPENEGLIDRNKLLNISGRSRKEQIKLAEEWKITEYNQPAGGCHLTDKNFGRRMKDLLDNGYNDFRETISLKWGRHFRINKNFRVILGKNEKENDNLIKYADKNDHIMKPADKMGPTLILKGDNPSEEILSTCAGLMQRFSKHKNDDPIKAAYWTACKADEAHNILAKILNDKKIKEMKI